MILVVAVLGHELFRVELATPQPEAAASGDDHELTAVSRHAGDFGFGPSPVRPYWTPEPGRRRMSSDDRPACFRCGCAAETHDHHRAGADCGHCGKSICREYRSRPSLAAYWWAIRAAVRLLATPRR